MNDNKETSLSKRVAYSMLEKCYEERCTNPRYAEILRATSISTNIATPLFGQMLYSCSICVTPDELVRQIMPPSMSLPTAFASVLPNRNLIVFAETFFKSLDFNQICWVLLHEVAHIFLEHTSRCNMYSLDPQIHNIAADFVVNALSEGAYRGVDENGVALKSGKVDFNVNYKAAFKPPFELHTLNDLANGKQGGVFDEKYVNWSVEEIYIDILKNNPEALEKMQANADSDDGEGEGEGGSAGSGNGEGDSTGQPKFQPLHNGDLIEHTHSDSQAVKDQVQKNIGTAQSAVVAAEAAKQIGVNEMGAVRTIHQLASPKVKWTTLLQAAVKANIETRLSYNRVSRRSTQQILFPVWEGEQPTILFGVDTSGSMSNDDINRAMSELKGILDDYEAWTVTVVSCDVVGHVIGQFDSVDNEDLKVENLELIGCGGTDMTPIVEHANAVNDEGELVYDNVIVVTDGYIPEEVNNVIRPDYNTIFVVTEGGNPALSVPRANVIHVN